MNIQHTISRLQSSPVTFEGFVNRVPSAPGLYALWVTGDTLASTVLETWDRRTGPLYVGKSVNLKERDVRMHYRSGSTAASTVRRSLGAILLDVLDLTPVRRGLTHFGFEDTGEDRLTHWMKRNLGLTWYQHPFPQLLESQVVAKLQPPLNLTYWKGNPHRAQIRSLRAGVKALAFA